MSAQPYRVSESRGMLEPAACDRCPLAERRKAKHLACRAFSLFIAGESPIAWNVVNRAPTRQRYDTLLDEVASSGLHAQF